MKNLLRAARWSLLLGVTSCGGGSCSIWTDEPDCPTCPPGTNGAVCRAPSSGASACDDDLVCNQNVCRPCGGATELCCFGGECEGSLACEGTSSSTRTACSDCGDAGERCCRPLTLGGTGFHVCYGGATCNIGTDVCEGGGGGPVGPCGGPTTFSVGCEDANGCGTIISVQSTSLSSAEECARASGCAATHGAFDLRPLELCVDFTFAGNGGISHGAFSDDDALRCARALSPGNCHWRPISPAVTSDTCLDDCSPCDPDPPAGCERGAVAL